jgi:hypothetical protein
VSQFLLSFPQSLNRSKILGSNSLLRSGGIMRITTAVSRFVLLMVLSMVLFGALAHGQEVATARGVVPNLINFSGVLNDLDGKPLSGIQGVTFLLYSGQQGGPPLWMETQNVQPDKYGRYTVRLGSTLSQGLPIDLFASGEARWLGVQVIGQEEQPRVLLVAVPYALKAADSQTIGGLPPSAFVLASSSASGSTAASASGTSSANSSAAPPPSASNVTTTGGTPNTIPMFTTASNIQNSILTQTGTTAINVAGALNLPAKGTATTSGAFNSQPQDFVASVFNSTTSTPVAQTFQWQAEPVNNDKSTASGTLNLLYGMGTATPAETGLKINSKGLFTFAAGQTFPGTGSGTVTSVGLSAPATDFAVSGSPVTSSGTLNLGWKVAPTSADTPNAIVKRDGSGNFNAGFVSASALSVTGAITGGTASANIISAGSKLGVGTAAPATALDVFSSTAGIHDPLARFGSSGTIDANSISVYNGSGTMSVFAVGGPSSFMPGTASGDGGLRVLPGKNIFLGDSGLSRLELTAGGNAIINNSLRVAGPPTGGSGAVAASFGGNGDFAIDAPFIVAGRFVVKDSTGNVGINNPNPGATLDVHSNTEFSPTVYFQNDNPIGYDVLDVVGNTHNDGCNILINCATLRVVAQSTSATAFEVDTPNQPNQLACWIDTGGNLFCTGSKSGVVPVDSGSRRVALYAVEAPENWFEDFGSGRLSNGSAIIALEPTFAQTVNTGVDYHVFLTPNGDSRGLYVFAKTPGSFEVREQGGGTSDIAFDYRIVAQRKGYENIRLQDKTEHFARATLSARRPSLQNAVPLNSR